ncbi:MAG: twin-arginine translocase subunit TatC [Desulfomicrobiaceae bacterium]
MSEGLRVPEDHEHRDMVDGPASELPEDASLTEPTDDDAANPHAEMTFTQHLEELRTRLVRSFIAIGVGFLVCYGFAEDLFHLLMRPLLDVLLPTGGTLIYTALPEAFFTYVKTAALAGFFVASPYVFYQMWLFVAPGLYESERKYLIPIALLSAIFFVVGACFGYFVVFPYGFEFFVGYATDIVKPMPSLSEYFNFAVQMLIAFGVIFELPLVIFFLARLGVVTGKWLRQKQKYAVLVIFIVAAILTPPDVVSQLLMAAPLLVLYEIGVWVAYLFGTKKPLPEEEAA